MSPTPPPVRWSDDHHLIVDDVTFSVLGAPDAGGDGVVQVFKSADMLRPYLALAAELGGARVVELGVFRGGSTALLVQLLRPQVLLAVDLRPSEPLLLGRFLDGGGHRHLVRGHWGVDQADGAALRAAVDDAGLDALDLVVDDASHVLGPSVASFDALFPLVRVGGVYAIEDWSGAVHIGARIVRAALEQAAPAPDGGGAGALVQRVDAQAEAFGVALVERALIDRPTLEGLYRVDPDRLRQGLAGRPDLLDRLRQHQPRAAAAILAGTAVDDLAAIPAESEAEGAPSPSDDDVGLIPLIAHLCRVACAAPGIIASVEVRHGVVLVRRGEDPVDPDGFDVAALADSGLAGLLGR